MIFKKGSPEKIKLAIVSEEQFDSMNKKIAEKNELIRCGKCGKLLSKVAQEGATIQHRGLRAIVFGQMSIRCVECGTITKF